MPRLLPQTTRDERREQFAFCIDRREIARVPVMSRPIETATSGSLPTPSKLTANLSLRVLGDRSEELIFSQLDGFERRLHQARERFPRCHERIQS